MDDLDNPVENVSSTEVDSATAGETQNDSGEDSNKDKQATESSCASIDMISKESSVIIEMDII